MPAGTFVLRKAEASDVDSIVTLIAADPLRASEESVALEDRDPYDLAFSKIDDDDAQLLVVAVAPAGDIVAPCS
ncbi:hypothetical protein [Arthrobacter sp. CG_A4]|uniref:hypothetical protein n=1 Tax=Arthrobacter sp. CG_A4 TaxID=3071706 RepID=UPI002E0D2F9E